jgi:hypothetical protein
MHRKGMKKKIATLILYLFPLLLISQMPATGLVLCWGKDGHVGFDAQSCNHNCCEAECEEHEETNPSPSLRDIASRNHSCECLDFTLFGQEVEPFIPTKGTAQSQMIAAQNFIPSCTWRSLFPDLKHYCAYRNENRKTPLICLRTVSLLI